MYQGTLVDAETKNKCILLCDWYMGNNPKWQWKVQGRWVTTKTFLHNRRFGNIYCLRIYILINFFQLFHNYIHQNLISLYQPDFQHWSRKESHRNLWFVCQWDGQDSSNFFHQKSGRRGNGKCHFLTNFDIDLNISQISLTKISLNMITGVLSY